MKKVIIAVLCCILCAGVIGIAVYGFSKDNKPASPKESNTSDNSSDKEQSSKEDDKPEPEKLKFELDSSGNAWLVTGCEGETEQIVIPSVYEDKPVTGIADGAFADKPSLSKVELPDSIKSIGKEAFRDCKSLTDIDFPEGLTEIKGHAFKGCKELPEIKLADSIEKIEGHAFEGCEKLSDITVPKNLNEIGEYAFKGCKELPGIELPDSIEKIGGHAFEDCTKLEDIELPGLLTKINGYMFKGCRTLAKVTIKGDLESIGDHVFSGCKELSGIELPQTLLEIGGHAFEGCEKLLKIEIPEKVTEIRDYTFNGCTLLIEVVIKGDVTRIGDFVFAHCPKLNEILVSEMPEDVSDDAFDGKVTIIIICEHDYEEVEHTDPTCIEDGYIQKKCTRCGKEITETLPALGHDWGEPEYIFAEDGKSCTSERVCKRDASHKETATATISHEVTKEATCAEKGETTYTATFEKDWAEKQLLTVEDIAELGHDYGDLIAEKPATCKEKGVKAHYHCDRCEKNFDEDKQVLNDLVISALGHNYGEWIAEVPATETKEGVKGHYHCDRCNKDFDAEYKMLESLVIPKIAPIVIPEVGETMTFGNYHGATEWMVLDKKADKTLIIAKDIIDAKPYNMEYVSITWENCTLRSWLNNEYINEAFSPEERNRILTTHVLNKDNTYYNPPTPGGNDTEDKVFLLSIEEAQNYFADDAARMAKGTDYAKEQGLWVYHSEGSAYDGYSRWWLRSPGDISEDAAIVICGGYVNHDILYGVGISDCGVRPALWIWNHRPDKVVIIKEPTCTEKGIIKYTWTVCGKTRTEEIPALGHNYGEWIEVLPNGIKEGIKGHYHCDRCGKDFDAEYNVLDSLIISKIPEVGETMTFGNYHGATEWIVLAKEADKTLIIAKDIIDSKRYNEQQVDITWENCTLRKWLNNEYINEVFSVEERSLIHTTHVVNNDNTWDNPPTLGGNDTEDKVFLLSEEEARTYFANGAARMAKGTDYAKVNNLCVYSNGNGDWWLRSPGTHYSCYASLVSCSGFINYYGDNVDDPYRGVRPALWIWNHYSDEGVITKQPTCTEMGLKTYTCTVCGKTKTEEIPALGHNLSEWIEEVPATETTEGVKGHYHCSRCGKDCYWSYFNKDYNIIESLIIPKGAIPIPKVGETMTFGNYHGATEWTVLDKVLDKEVDKTLIIAKDILDVKPYNVQQVSITWENCTLRSWLNNEYINTAFTAEERNRILMTHVLNKDNTYNTYWKPPTPGGNDTEDKIFLLSIEEANTYFADNAARMAKGTDYAKGNGLWVDDWGTYRGNSEWWLRSPGDDSHYATHVRYDGYIYYYDNCHVDYSACGVRPALWIWNLNHSWNEGVITRQPTCTETGIRTYTCNVCGKTRTEAIPALGHNYGDWIEEVPATKTKEGIKGHYHCSRCGKDFYWNYLNKDYNIIESLVIPKGTNPIPEIGETMIFGNYHGATEWIVLANDEEKTLIIAKDIINAKPYNTEYVNITWENCTLRSWLNNEYIDTAFSAEERNRILTTHVVNNDNTKYNPPIPGGNDTEDKVFLLSYNEANKYFANDAARMAKGTDYAKGNGLWVKEDWRRGNIEWWRGRGNSEWWLRSPGHDSKRAAGVRYGGYVHCNYDYVFCPGCGVRPALWIRNQ